MSNNIGKVLFMKNMGSSGFVNMEKRSLSAVNAVIIILMNYIVSCKEKYIFLKIEGVQKSILMAIYKQFILLVKQHKLQIVGVKLVHKVVHNGCREKK